jgi:hypothetical protein
MSDWITSFLASTSAITSPEIYRKWTAIYTLSAALERKVWIRTSSGVLYPNLYVVLIGPPGVGKTESIWRSRELIQALGTHHMAPSNVTKAALIDALNLASRHIIRPKETPASVIFNSLQIISNELGVLLPAYDTEFMNNLQDLYDCKNYSESKRSRETKIEIKNPQISLLAGCTPSYLQGIMPEGAWDQGFISRVILIYSGERVIRPLFEFAEIDTEETKMIQQGLKTRAALYGKITFEPDAITRLEQWHASGGEPRPEHPKLHHYCSRRTVHALKLSAVAAVSETAQLTVTGEHVARALDWLVEAEVYMEDIFKEMSSTSHGELLQDVWHFIYRAYNKEGKRSVNERRVLNYVAQRTPAHNVARTLEVMEKGGVIERVMKDGYIGYLPKGKM